MNDQHPHAGYVGDDAYTTGSFATDPLFGAMPGSQNSYDQGSYDQSGYDAGHSGQYDTTQWSGGQQWDVGSYDNYVAQQQAAPQQYDTTGQWDAAAWNQAGQTGQFEAAQFTSYDTTGQWVTPTFETGTYDATAWNYPAPEPEAVVPHQYTPEPGGPEYLTESEYAAESGPEFLDAEPRTELLTEVPQMPQAYPADAADHLTADHLAETMTAPVVSAYSPAAQPAAARPVRRAGGSRGRRRTPAKRSALLTVAVPSACVMGVAGIAAASVSGLTNGTTEQKDDTTSLAAADPASVKPVAANSQLDTQLAALSADARDFGDRASRTQERIDLKARQEAERKKREEEAARKEALRPKFALPVELHQLSARYGQAGVNWMSLHTGIDFPVQYGTPVMAATDGTVRTQWNSAYGNMAIVTAKDGTETWYCHLSTTKIRSGKVKAGEVIAYSGNSGNSTGPHLHFEVRPGGGSAIDPLPWLRSHGLDPTG
ncbi:M23 family metallopeptidase [Streptomyces purpureus]|uniref:Peptidase n=1 Tax=Streptomyces purpureus TaxID=1951 RepID=A0A918HF73_9ACTN|nr:M23 family metallopeptidase [Streptomyces purpureus]GGT58738.1 peptidase [Streptomyces purpureus]